MESKLDFLTEKRQQLLAQGGIWANDCIRDILRNKGHIVQHKSPLLKAQEIRGWLVGYTAESVSSDESIVPRSLSNIDGLQIDGKYFLSYKKHPSPEICPEETPTLRSARLERVRRLVFPDQLMLPTIEDSLPIDELLLSLSDLEHFLICYTTKDNLITRLYVVDPDFKNRTIRDYLEIDLSLKTQEEALIDTEPPSIVQNDQSSRLRFAPKPKDADEKGKTA